MKRPLLDRLASTLFRLENDRVQASSTVDEKGRFGEPMQWSERESLANKFSEVFANNRLGYRFKQWVADIVAGDYDQQSVKSRMNEFIENNTVAIFSFTTCPFCRRAKDALDERGIAYQSMELDLDPDGNAIRAELGRRVQRTSVPSIFVRGKFIGGCNDGPGLMPLLEDGSFYRMLERETEF